MVLLQGPTAGLLLWLLQRVWMGRHCWKGFSADTPKGALECGMMKWSMHSHLCDDCPCWEMLLPLCNAHDGLLRMIKLGVVAASRRLLSAVDMQ